MRFRFPIVIIDEDFRSENASGIGIRVLVKAIEEEGMEVLGATSFGDLASFAQQQSRASAFILYIDDEEFTTPEASEHAMAQIRAFVQGIRFRNADIPIFLYGETRTSRNIPNDVLKELHGFIHMFEDTPTRSRPSRRSSGASRATSCTRWSTTRRSRPRPTAASGSARSIPRSKSGITFSRSTSSRRSCSRADW